MQDSTLIYVSRFVDSAMNEKAKSNIFFIHSWICYNYLIALATKFYNIS